uniref:EF-hand calcium-binding domain-containing protein 13 n=1 Tax=Ictidomys tridecemlineatus TaxID=43179 RepID=UPI001A9E2827|nr:EF-hand calcium-binding domain-containing protein 13 [Ictidomys tridecemlineatus]
MEDPGIRDQYQVAETKKHRKLWKKGRAEVFKAGIENQTEVGGGSGYRVRAPESEQKQSCWKSSEWVGWRTKSRAAGEQRETRPRHPNTEFRPAVRSQLLMRWGPPARPQRFPVGAQTAASSAASPPPALEPGWCNEVRCAIAVMDICKGKPRVETERNHTWYTPPVKIASPSLKLSKEEMTRKESTLCQLPNQYHVPKTSLPLYTSSSFIWEKKLHSNLSLTLYEEIPQGHFYAEELSELLKACKIFSKIRSGKIYVNDLPMVLGTLKISISDSEMLQALKTIDINVNGMLDFSNFLKAVNDISYVTSQDSAFQKALEIFSRIKDGRVPTDEVVAVLSSMNIFVNPDTLQEVIKYSYTDRNQMVDIGDIVFALNELQQPYEDVSIIEDSAPDETTLDSELPNVAGHSLQRRIRSLPARPSESSILKNLNGKSLQYHSNIMENDDTEFKQSRYSWPVGQFLGRVDSNHEIHDPKSVPQSLKNVISLSKSLDKIDISSVPKLEKLVVRRPSTLLKQISSEKNPAITTLVLPDVTENLHNISKEQMNVSDLWNILSTLNSNLKKDEFLDALKFTTVDEFQEIVLALDSLEGDMISGENLEDFLRNIGIKSPKEEVEKILQSDLVSEDNMVNVKDCMRALRDTQKFSNFIALNETINKLDCMKEGYQSDKDKYSDVLENNDRHFTDKTLQKTEDDSFVEEIKEAAHILSHVDNGKIDIPNLKHALKCLNANLTEEDVNEALKHCDISDNMAVDLKDFLLEMKENPHFKESKATQLLLATTQILQDDLIDVSDLKMLLMNNDLYPANAIFNEVLRHIPEHEYGKVTVQEFMSKLSDTLTIPKATGVEDKFYNMDIHKNDLRAVSDIHQNLNAIGIYLTDDKIQKTLDNTNPNDEVVHFEDFIRKLANTDEFIECQRIEDAWNIVKSVSDGKVKIKDLLSTLKSMEIPLNEYQPNPAIDGLV